MKDLHLEYKGYTCTLYHNPEDGNRLYGQPCAPDSPENPLQGWGFAGNSVAEARKAFEEQVDIIIDNENHEKENEKWRRNNDYLSIAAVLNILPDVFEERIMSNEFDKGLLTGVEGGEYVVPLYYVTKAWDVLLNGSLGFLSFLVGPEEDDDYSEEVLREYVNDENIDRTRGQAMAENERMKKLWLKYFEIDIDALDVDFNKFDMHMTPNVSSEECYSYFLDVPNGVSEWIFDAIKYPSDDWSFNDAVSSLMEMTAYIMKYVRHESFDVRDYNVHVVGVESDQRTYALLCRQLADDCFDVFPSAEMIDSGRVNAKERKKSAEMCDVAVLMQTRNTGRSKKYQKEVMDLIAMGKPFVTISIKADDVILPGKMFCQQEVFTENEGMAEKYNDLRKDIIEMCRWVDEREKSNVWRRCELSGDEYEKADALYHNGMEAREQCDLKKAKALLTESAEMGLPKAKVMLAFVVHDMDDSESSKRRQFELLSQAAEYGIWPAMRTLGNLYEKGDGCEKDTERAMSWYLLAAKEGVGCACADIADFYDKGVYFKRNLGKALFWTSCAYASKHGEDEDFEKEFDRLLKELFGEFD